MNAPTPPKFHPTKMSANKRNMMEVGYRLARLTLSSTDPAIKELAEVYLKMMPIARPDQYAELTARLDTGEAL